MKEKLLNIVSFIREHWPLALIGVVIGVVFFKLHYFAELAYAAIRLIAVLFAAALVLNLMFKETLRKYINEGQLVADFHALDPKHKVFATLSVIAVLLLISALCFVHP